MRHEMIPLGMNVPQVAKAFAASGLFEDAQDLAKAITKIIAGRDYGLGPVASMSGLHVMKGKVEVGGHVIAGGIKASAKYDYRVKAKTAEVCRLLFREMMDGKWVDAGVEEYTIADAQTAGLSGSQTYRKFPKNMLFNRCISNGYKTYCPDVFLSGPTYVPGELGGPVNDDGTTGETKAVTPKNVVTKPGRNGRPTDYEGASPDPAPPAEASPPAAAPARDGPPPRDESHQEAYNTCLEACKAYKAVMQFPRDRKRYDEALSALGAADYNGREGLIRLATTIEKEMGVVRAVNETAAADPFEVPA
jgi:hypothetical protein